MDGSTLVDFFKGHMSRKVIRIYTVLMAAYFFGFMLVSLAFYPGVYSFIERPISSLGNPRKNPFPGWLFFSIAFWGSAVLLVPFASYIHARMSKILKGASRASLFFSLVAFTGMMLLGFFSESHAIDDLHNVAAAMSFGGYFFSFLFTWIVIGHDIRTRGKQKRHFSPLHFFWEFSSIVLRLRQFHIYLFLYSKLEKSSANFSINSILVIIGTGATQLLAELIEFDPEPWYIGFPVWEWGLLFAISIHAVLLALITPAAIEQVDY